MKGIHTEVPSIKNEGNISKGSMKLQTKSASTLIA
jgi:hypothetical protein